MENQELVRYKKMLSINEHATFSIEKYSSMLISYMVVHSVKNREYVEFFKMNLTSSEKLPRGKDLILEWASSSLGNKEEVK